MTRSILVTIALVVGASLPSVAGAQSPPGGFVPATVPGGTMGIAGPANVAEAIRGGNAMFPAHTYEVEVGPMVTGSVSRPANWSVGGTRPGVR